MNALAFARRVLRCPVAWTFAVLSIMLFGASLAVAIEQQAALQSDVSQALAVMLFVGWAAVSVGALAFIRHCSLKHTP